MSRLNTINVSSCEDIEVRMIMCPFRPLEEHLYAISTILKGSYVRIYISYTNVVDAFSML